MDPMTIMMAVSAVVGVAGSIMGGVQQSAQANVAAQQAEQDRTFAKVKALEDENLRRQNLLRVRSSQIAAYAGQGLDVGASGSLDAIAQGDENQAMSEIGLIRAGAVVTDQRYKAAISSDQSASAGYLMGGLLGAAGTVGSAGMDYYKSYGLPGSGATSPKSAFPNTLQPAMY